MKTKIFILLLFVLIACNNTKFENRNYNRVKIPVVKKEINDKSYLFIIDSGANVSLIDSSFYYSNTNLFKFEDEVDLIFTGISSQRELRVSLVSARINNNKTLFAVSDINPIINSFREYNYEIVGILGSDYLLENRYIIDYNRKILR